MTVSVFSTAPVAALLICTCFAPGGAVPVEEVQLQVVRLAVGQVHVDSEAGGRVPAGGDASGAAGILECPRVGRARGPGVTRTVPWA